VKATLNQIADIRNGYQFRGKVEALDLGDDPHAEERFGAVRVIQIKDIDDYRRLNPNELAFVALDRDIDKYEAREGDVLFLARGHRLFATAITAPLHNTVATGYFFILRPATPQLEAPYLAWYINQAPFQTVLRTFMKGTQQPLVSRKDIEHLEVEIPPLEVQRAIVALEDLRVEEQRLMSTLQEKRNQLVQALSMHAARRTS
jgi:restriction endonuclease S subunit